MNARFHCMLPIRDEADIIGQSLTHLLKWADAIYIFDTGSVDDTWEIVQDYALKDKRILPLRKDQVFFSDKCVRGWMFQQTRGHMQDGDWFLRVDADEFYHIPPPIFVNKYLNTNETVVYHQYYNFVLRESDVESWFEQRETIADRVRPIEERRQWYEVSLYAEPRLCRYRSTMRWPETVSFPFNAGYVAQARLPIRHYPHRDPAQLMRRCRLRAVMMADKDNRSNWTSPELHHWAEKEWQKFITHDNNINLKRWIPGTPLEEVKQLNHLASPYKRLIQQFTHRHLLSILDGTRPSWHSNTYPQKISPEIIKKLETELKLNDCI